MKKLLDRLIIGVVALLAFLALGLVTTYQYDALVGTSTSATLDSFIIGATTPLSAFFTSAAIKRVSVSFSATPAFDASAGNIQLFTLTGNVTGATVTNMGISGESRNLEMLLCQDSGGAHTFTFATSILWSGGVACTNTSRNTTFTNSNKCTLIGLMYDGTSIREAGCVPNE